MAKRQVEYLITADSTQAMNASRRLIDSAKAYGQNLEEAGNRGSHGFGRMADQVSRMTALITGAGGLLAAWKLITGEMERQKNMQQDSAERLRSVTESQQALLRNLPGITRSESQTLFRDIREMSLDTGVKRAELTNAMAEAVSASGGDVPASLAAVRAAAMYMPEQPGSIPMMAGALLDIQKSTGVNDAMTNLGVLQYVGSKSRIVKPELQAKNIAPALIGMTAAGATTEGGAELYSWLTTQTADVTGERSRTAAINFAVKSREFFEAESIKGPATMAQRIAYLQKRPELAGKFLSGLGGEVQFKPVFEKLFEPGSAAQGAYRDITERIPGVDGMAQAGRNAIARRAFVPGEPVYDIERGFEVSTEDIALSPRQALAAVIRNQLYGSDGKPGLMDRIEGTALFKKLDKMKYEAYTLGGTRDVLEQATSEITGAQRDILHGARTREYRKRTGIPYTGGFSGDIPLVGGFAEWQEKKEFAATPLRTTEQEREMLQLLGKLYMVMFEARQELSRINSNTKGSESYDRKENE